MLEVKTSQPWHHLTIPEAVKIYKCYSRCHNNATPLVLFRNFDTFANVLLQAQKKTSNHQIMNRNTMQSCFNTKNIKFVINIQFCLPKTQCPILNPFPNKPWFLRVCSTSLLKTMWEKKKLLVRSNFSFSHSVFYPFGEVTAVFIKFEIVVCNFFEFGRV